MKVDEANADIKNLIYHHNYLLYHYVSPLGFGGVWLHLLTCAM